MHRLTRILAIGGLVLTAAGTSPATAKDFGSLYSDAELTHWAERYRPGIMGNINDVLLPRLEPDERRALGAFDVAIPLRAPDGNPLNFYAQNGTVVVPALSLKFFDDLSIAFAWLWKNGYSPETALEYIGLLKYGNEADYGRWPRPLTALRIPDDALNDPDVDSLSQKMFKSAIVFILLHEMGHVLYRHPGYGPGVARADARANEAEADTFALEVMRRLPAQPTGMVFYFQSLVYFGANRGDYASDTDFNAALDDATHPVTPDRLRAIARILQDRADDFAAEYPTREQGVTAATYLAGQIDGIADIVADPDLQRLIAQTSRRATLAALAPRRPGETLAAGAPATHAGEFSGTYDGTISGGGETFSVRMILNRDGARVGGFYNFGAGIGQLEGTIEGTTLRMAVGQRARPRHADRRRRRTHRPLGLRRFRPRWRHLAGPAGAITSDKSLCSTNMAWRMGACQRAPVAHGARFPLG